MADKHLYAAFEAQHRGPRKLIKQRLSVYIPFIHPLKDIYPDALAIDIGCGRGEWLELLEENQISSLGIDQDEGMLLQCRQLNLNVLHADGIQILTEKKNESCIIISAFHVVEHISFDALQTLIKEAFRVLKPGGLLILETPNPENIKVSTESFYLDPTHLNPIPNGLLSFLPEYFGFYRTKTVRLQENKSLMSKKDITLLDVMGEVSPDYSIIAQKSADKNITSLFDDVYSKQFGYSLSFLSAKFEERLLRIEVNSEKIAYLQNEVEAYHILRNSTSWKITKPLRFIARTFKWILRQPIKILRRYIAIFKYKIYSSYKVKQTVKYILTKSPFLEKVFLSIMNPSHYKKHTFFIPRKTKRHLKSIKKRIEKRKKDYHA